MRLNVVHIDRARLFLPLLIAGIKLCGKAQRLDPSCRRKKQAQAQAPGFRTFIPGTRMVSWRRVFLQSSLLASGYNPQWANAENEYPSLALGLDCQAYPRRLLCAF